MAGDLFVYDSTQIGARVQLVSAAAAAPATPCALRDCARTFAPISDLSLRPLHNERTDEAAIPVPIDSDAIRSIRLANVWIRSEEADP